MKCNGKKYIKLMLDDGILIRFFVKNIVHVTVSEAFITACHQFGIPDAAVNEVAWLYGYWLRYGTKNSQEVCVGPDDDEIIEAIQGLADVLHMNAEGPFISDATVESRPLRTVISLSAQVNDDNAREDSLWNLFNSLPVEESRAIPSWLHCESINTRIHVLAGYIDATHSVKTSGDGNIVCVTFGIGKKVDDGDGDNIDHASFNLFRSMGLSFGLNHQDSTTHPYRISLHYSDSLMQVIKHCKSIEANIDTVDDIQSYPLMLDFAVVPIDIDTTIDAAYDDYINKVQVDCDETNKNMIKRLSNSSIAKTMRGFKSFQLSNTEIVDMAQITNNCKWKNRQ